MEFDWARPLARGGIREYGLGLLDSIDAGAGQVLEWREWLEGFEYKGGYIDEDYGWLTAVLALRAVSLGNAGVGCVLVEREGEVIVKGHNQVFHPYFRSDLHAEMMVMDRFEDLKLDISPRDLTLYTSVESCPMCAVRMMGGGIGKVLHLADDLETGMTRRLGDLPPRWVELADEVVFGKADCSDALIEAAWRIFLINIDELFELVKNL
jgi:cytosine deaminase